MRKLVDLNPRFVAHGGEGIFRRDPATGALTPVPRTDGVGVMFDCPCGCAMRCYVPFANPLGGGTQPLEEDRIRGWQRTGDTFETLTLTPSILRSTDRGGCGWHGYLTAGELRPC